MKKALIILAAVFVLSITLSVLLLTLSGGLKALAFFRSDEGALKADDFEEGIEEFGESMGEFGESFGADMEQFGESFGSDMEQFGKSMESFGESMEVLGDNFEVNTPWWSWIFGLGKRVNMSVEQAEQMPIGDADQIDVSTVVSEIHVYESDDDTVKARFYGSYYGRRQEPKLIMERTGSSIKAMVQYSTLNVGFVTSNLKLDLYIPKSYHGGLAAHTTSGDIVASDWSFSSVDMTSVSGDFTLSGIETERIELSTTSGKMDCDALKADEMNCSSVSGDVMVRDGAIGSVMANTTSGEVSISGLSGGADIGTVSGSISIIADKLSDDYKLSTTSGDVIVKLPEQAQFVLGYDTTSGSYQSDFKMVYNSQSRSQVDGYTNENGVKLEIDTVSGDLELNAK